VPVQVALVGEPGPRGGLGGRVAGFQQRAGAPYSVGDLQRVRRQAGAVSKELDEPEFPYPGHGCQLVQTDGPLGVLGQVVTGNA
jgi:hypothetical protein